MPLSTAEWPPNERSERTVAKVGRDAEHRELSVRVSVCVCSALLCSASSARLDTKSKRTARRPQHRLHELQSLYALEEVLLVLLQRAGDKGVENAETEEVDHGSRAVDKRPDTAEGRGANLWKGQKENRTEDSEFALAR